MPSVAETAYPRLKSHFTVKKLREIYTPTSEDVKLAIHHTTKADTRLNFLILLKTFQRLGYFIPLQSVPQALVKHICSQMKRSITPRTLTKYDASRAKWRHAIAIREYLKIKPYGVEARRLIVASIAQAAITKHDLADLINIAIEELIHHRYELPVFNTLATAAKRIRHTIHKQFYKQVFTSLRLKDRVHLDSIFEPNSINGRTPWNDLKQDPGRPILKNLTALVGRLQWLDEINVNKDISLNFPMSRLNSLRPLNVKPTSLTQAIITIPSFGNSLKVTEPLYLAFSNGLNSSQPLLIPPSKKQFNSS